MEMLTPPVVSDADVAQRLHAEPEVFLRACLQRYGSVFTLPVGGGKRITYVLDPHVTHELLSNRAVDFSPVSRQSKTRFGLGAVVSTDLRVQALSTALIRSLRGRNLKHALARFEEGLQEAVAAYAQTLGGASVRTAQDVIYHTLIPATVHALFGRDLFDDTFIDDFLQYSASVAKRLAGSDPTLDAAGAEAEAALLDRLAGVWRRRESPVLSTFCATLLDRSAATHDERVRTLLMLMWGSMVNLIPTGVWMYSSVLQQPSLAARIRATHDPALRHAVISETLRLFSRPNMYREVSRELDLALSDGRTVRLAAGDWVALFPRLLHHDPEVFGDPLRFDPARFCPAHGASGARPCFDKGDRPLRHETLVFGLGRGRCPGDGFTLGALDRLLDRLLDAFEARLITDPLPEAVAATVSSTPEPSRQIAVSIRPFTGAGAPPVGGNR